ncbi:MAG: DegV family protein [Ruminococcus sp.]|nr:DegV family protein [Ruminococcus sp.]
MADYRIFTDSPADLPADLYKKHDIGVIHLSFTMDGKDYKTPDEIGGIEEFYNRLRKGSMSKTSQVTEEEVRRWFVPTLEEGRDILMLAFSSGLSASYDSTRRVAKILEEEYPERTICVVDTLCASLGQGLFVLKACEQKAKGVSLAGVRDWAEANKLNVGHVVMADDLFHLKRGGRISAAAAVAGSILGVKPIIHMNNEGKLIPIGKVRGKQQALLHLVDLMDKQKGDWDNPFIAVCHADDLESAQLVAKEVRRRYGIKNAVINHIGPVIGSHTGPGTIALFFMGDYR